MELITSTANERVKAVKKLRQKKFRDETGLFTAEGVNILSDMPASVRVRQFFIADGFKRGAEDIISRYEAEVFYVSDAVMSALSDTVSPSGIIAVIERTPPVEAPSNALVLDGISDCGNLGTIIRTAAGADFLNIFALDCADAFAPKTVRASMGGVFRTEIFEIDCKELADRLTTYEKIRMDMEGGDVFGHCPSGRVALFLGNEAHGLSDFSRGLAETSLTLHMSNGQESLNVAVAAGIAMYVISDKQKNK